MGIFKKTLSKSEDNSTFVGAYIPLQVNTYLTIYSLATGISKQKLIINLITQFNQDTEQDMSVNELIEQVALKGFETWGIESKKNNYSQNSFFNKMYNELSKKGIDYETCQNIIKKVKDETKKA